MVEMNFARIAETVSNQFDSLIVPTLIDYIRIPNKSPHFDPDWKAHGYMDEAANLLLQSIDRFDVKGIEYRIVELPDRTPLIFAIVEPYLDGAGNVLLYGHLDKQPEFAGWRDDLGPWTPVLKGDRLYGRGGGDDGYAIFSALSAISALQRANEPHPRCVLLIEGCEESGSYDLPYYIDFLSEEIRTPDVVVTLDAEAGNYEQLWLTTSLRGMLMGTLRVDILTEGVHSGGAGGIVPSSFRLLRSILDRIEDPQSGTLHSSLRTKIPDWVHHQSSAVAETLGSTVIDRYSWARRPDFADNEIPSLLTANSWEPSMATVGLGGAPQPADAGNTLRPYTEAKLVFRLPPNADAQACAHAIKHELELDPPNGAQISFEVDAAESGWHMDLPSVWIEESLNEASKSFFGGPMRYLGCGGTIPFMNMLGNRFRDCEYVVTGVLGPHSNAHGPNEFLHLPTTRNVTCCVAHVLATRARQER